MRLHGSMVEQATLNRQAGSSSLPASIIHRRWVCKSPSRWSADGVVALLIWGAWRPGDASFAPTEAERRQERVGSSPVACIRKNGGKVECSRVKHTEN